MLIDGYGHARLTDFGIARPRDATSLTQTGHVIGTERYLAPEVKAGRAGDRALRPLRARRPARRARRRGRRAGAGLAERLRDPDPEQRPASAAAALAELERATADPAAGEADAALCDRAASPSRRHAAFEPTLTRAAGARSAATAGSPWQRSAWRSSRVAVALLARRRRRGRRRGQTCAERGSSAGRGRRVRGSRLRGRLDDRGADDDEEPATTDEPAADTGGTAAPASDDGFALNDQGFALIQEGSYEEAVPVLEKAVEALRDSGDEATYNYALYNLADRLPRRRGPDAAIPLLEERMQFDDGQLAEVEATLDEAYEAAGEEPPARARQGPAPGTRARRPIAETDDLAPARGPAHTPRQRELCGSRQARVLDPSRGAACGASTRPQESRMPEDVTPRPARFATASPTPSCPPTTPTDAARGLQPPASTSAPTAVAPRGSAETAAIVAAARDAGLRIAPQGSSHNTRRSARSTTR